MTDIEWVGDLTLIHESKTGGSVTLPDIIRY